MSKIDVDIYISNVRTFLNKNKDSASYFFGNKGEETFYELLTIFAIENDNEKEDPSLTMEQFEEIRQTIISKYGEDSISHTVIPIQFSLN